MQKFVITLVCVFLLAAYSPVYSQMFNYVSPKDNSSLVSLGTNIILKSSEKIDLSSLSPNEFSVTGSASGTHQGIVKLSDDNKTILFFPATPFLPNENVNVQLRQGMKTESGTALPSTTIHFTTTPLSQRIEINPLTLLNDGLTAAQLETNATVKPARKIASTNTLPSDFPAITIDSSNNPSNGKLFMANFSLTPHDTIGNYIMIVNNDGSVAKYKKFNQPTFNFQVLPNGELSYANVAANFGSYGLVSWIITDTALNPVDTFQCGNGYVADLHDFMLLPNGHAIAFAYDPEPIDMSPYGGSPNATVIGTVIQEIDASKNVVFQWRTWDYLPITDSYIDLTTQTVDLIHANAFDVDQSGNILLSMRHLSSIVNIDRQTGNLNWILGGKENQFTFINENESNNPNYFSFQHNVRVQPNGDITLFDNGNQHLPNYSRGVEYQLDEQNKTATLVWQYRHTPDIYAYAMGTVERLANGNTLIGWGIASSAGAPVLTEVKPDNTTALELSLSPGQMSYRSYKFPWVSQQAEATVTVGELGGLLQGNTYAFNSSNDTTGVTIKFDSLNSSPYPTATVSVYNYAPVNPLFAGSPPLMVSNYFNFGQNGITSYSGEVQINLYNFPSITNPRQTIVYARSGSESNFIALPTSYDSTMNVLTFTTSTIGDFAFGIPQSVDSSYAPVPMLPKDSAIVNGQAPVKLVWGTRGIIQTYHLQVTTDPSFSTVVVDNSTLTSTSFRIDSVRNDTTYYWRINNTNAAGTSNWSNTEIFTTSAPFIKVLSPNGGEKFYVDSSYVIRWQSNINDTVNIDLMNGNTVVAKIGDTIYSGTNAIKWSIPSNVPPDSIYKIMVTSISNAGISGSSNSTLTILSGVTGVRDPKNIVRSYALYQNYPDPFNPTATIQYDLPTASRVSLKIYNLLGQLVATLYDGVEEPGSKSAVWSAVNLSSGVYFYKLDATSTGDPAKTFSQIRKMVLLK